MNISQAKLKVEEHINKAWHAEGHDKEHGNLIIVKETEKPYGWVFFCAAQKFWETRDMSHAIAGNGPIVFDNRSETLHQLGTAGGPEHQIRQWEAENAKV